MPRLTCPRFSSGGWWQSECEETNLNGNYVTPRSRGRLDRGKGLYWKPKKGRYYLLKSTKIMIHPTDLKSLDWVLNLLHWNSEQTQGTSPHQRTLMLCLPTDAKSQSMPCMEFLQNINLRHLRWSYKMSGEYCHSLKPQCQRAATFCGAFPSSQWNSNA